MVAQRLLLFASRVGRKWLLSSECKLTKLILHTRCPSYHLTSRQVPHDKLALIQKPPGQIPKAFKQYGVAEKTKNYLGINASIKPTI